MTTVSVMIANVDPVEADVLAACRECIEGQSTQPTQVFDASGPLGGAGSRYNAVIERCAADVLAVFAVEASYAPNYLADLLAFMGTTGTPAVTRGLHPLATDGTGTGRIVSILAPASAFDVEYLRRSGLRFAEEARPLWTRAGTRLVETDQSTYRPWEWMASSVRRSLSVRSDRTFCGRSDLVVRVDSLSARVECSGHCYPEVRAERDWRESFLRPVRRQGLREKAQSFLAAITGPDCPDDVYQQRLGICLTNACGHLRAVADGHYCGACGCGKWRLAELRSKLRHANLECPCEPPLWRKWVP